MDGGGWTIGGTPTVPNDPAGRSLSIRDLAGNSVELADPGIWPLEGSRLRAEHCDPLQLQPKVSILLVAQ